MMVGFFETALVEQDLSLGGPQVKPLEGGQYEVTFKYRPPPAAKAKAVYLAGTFNDGKPDGHRMEGPDRDGAFATRLTLKKGSHEYKVRDRRHHLEARSGQPPPKWGSTTIAHWSCRRHRKVLKCRPLARQMATTGRQIQCQSLLHFLSQSFTSSIGRLMGLMKRPATSVRAPNLHHPGATSCIE
jgi:hypothetical protein